jgi:hypothetical protein
VRNVSIRVIDVNEKNVDDALRVCTFPSIRNETRALRQDAEKT